MRLGLSLATSVLIGVPLSVTVARHLRVGAIILGRTGMLWTILSLAILAILMEHAFAFFERKLTPLALRG